MLDVSLLRFRWDGGLGLDIDELEHVMFLYINSFFGSDPFFDFTYLILSGLARFETSTFRTGLGWRFFNKTC